MPDKRSHAAHAVVTDMTWTSGSLLADASDIAGEPLRVEAPTMVKQAGPHPDHIGKYLVEDDLGGGMSRVYRAKDPRLGKTVAIKVLREDFSADQDNATGS